MPVPAGAAARAAGRSSVRATQLVRRGGPAKWSRSNQRGPGGLGGGGVDGDDLKIQVAEAEQAVVGGHVGVLAATGERDAKGLFDMGDAFGQGFGGDGNVVEGQHQVPG